MTEPAPRKPQKPFVFTYEEDLFTFRNRAMQCWLLGVTTGAILLAVFAPPAFWLCAPGFVLIGVASIARSARTEERSAPLTWFEGWAGCTGAILLFVSMLCLVQMN